MLTSLVDVPEEVCDLNPQKTCRFITKLVPKLKPEHQCTIVPKETCTLKFTQPKQVDKPLLTKWCLDPTPAAPGESYDEENAAAPPIGVSASAPQPSIEEQPPQYQPEQSVPLDTGYLSPGARTGRTFQAVDNFRQAPPPQRSQRRQFGTPF